MQKYKIQNLINSKNRKKLSEKNFGQKIIFLAHRWANLAF
jgi:hypothetical protein